MSWRLQEKKEPESMCVCDTPVALPASWGGLSLTACRSELECVQPQARDHRPCTQGCWDGCTGCALPSDRLLLFCF